MNYHKLYNTIIEKRKINIPSGYTEMHHIIPRCLGGSDDKDNLVKLTAKEHFICHLLLTKMYNYGSNEYYKMCNAFLMMLVQSKDNERYITARKYEKLKSSFSERMSKLQSGKNNSQYGTKWFYDPISLKAGKYKECPFGWLAGRTPKNGKKCLICDEYTGTNKKKYCDLHRPKRITPTQRGYILTEDAKLKIKNYCLSRSVEEHPQYGKIWINNTLENMMIQKEELNNYIQNGWLRGKIK